MVQNVFKSLNEMVLLSWWVKYPKRKKGYRNVRSAASYRVSRIVKHSAHRMKSSALHVILACESYDHCGGEIRPLHRLPTRCKKNWRQKEDMTQGDEGARKARKGGKRRVEHDGRPG